MSKLSHPMLEGFNAAQMRIYFVHLAFTDDTKTYIDWMRWLETVIPNPFDEPPEIRSLRLQLCLTGNLTAVVGRDYIDGVAPDVAGALTSHPIGLLIEGLKGTYCAPPTIILNPTHLIIGDDKLPVDEAGITKAIGLLRDLAGYHSSLEWVSARLGTVHEVALGAPKLPNNPTAKVIPVLITQSQQQFLRDLFAMTTHSSITPSLAECISWRLARYATIHAGAAEALTSFWSDNTKVQARVLHEHKLFLARQGLLLARQQEQLRRTLRLGLLQYVCEQLRIRIDRRLTTPEALLESLGTRREQVERREQAIDNLIIQMSNNTCTHLRIPIARIVADRELRQQYVGAVVGNEVSCEACRLPVCCAHQLVLADLKAVEGTPKLPTYSEIIRKDGRNLFCKLCGAIVQETMFEPSDREMQDPEIRRVLYGRLMMCRTVVKRIDTGPLGRGLDAHLMDFLYPIVEDGFSDIDKNKAVVNEQRDVLKRLYCDVQILTTLGLLGYHLKAATTSDPLGAFITTLTALHSNNLQLLGADNARLRTLIVTSVKNIKGRIGGLTSVEVIDTRLQELNSISIFRAANITFQTAEGVTLATLKALLKEAKLPSYWAPMVQVWMDYDDVGAPGLPEPLADGKYIGGAGAGGGILPPLRYRLSGSGHITWPTLAFHNRFFRDVVDLTVTYQLVDGKIKKWDKGGAPMVDGKITYRDAASKFTYDPAKAWAAVMAAGKGCALFMSDQVSVNIGQQILDKTMHGLFIERFTGMCPVNGAQHRYNKENVCSVCGISATDFLQAKIPDAYYRKYSSQLNKVVFNPVVESDRPAILLDLDLPDGPSVDAVQNAATLLDCSPQQLLFLGALTNMVFDEVINGSESTADGPRWSRQRVAMIRSYRQALFSALGYIAFYSERSAIVMVPEYREWLRNNTDVAFKAATPKLIAWYWTLTKKREAEETAPLNGSQVLLALIDEMTEFIRVYEPLGRFVCAQILDDDRRTSLYNRFDYIDMMAQANDINNDAEELELRETAIKQDAFFQDFTFEGGEDNIAPVDS